MTDPQHPTPHVTLYHGNNLDILPTIPDNSIDSIVTDPPYELGFMGKQWDSTGIAYNVNLWVECLRVLKPGGHLCAFGGTRTYHRMTVAIEDAGFDIRDSLHWIYGSGFPKSHNLQGEWEGWGTALKPAHEPIVLARKPLIGTVAANVLQHGTGALNINACRIGYASENDKQQALAGDAFKRKDTSDKGWSRPWMEDQERIDRMNREAKERAQSGRWPANIILDDWIADTEDDWPRYFYCAKPSKAERNAGTEHLGAKERQGNRPNSPDYSSGKFPDHDHRSTGGNNHPTVKPLALMQWLIRLVTPPEGVVLDPFTGSGTTLAAATLEGINSIGIELTDDYLPIITARCQWAQTQHNNQPQPEPTLFDNYDN